MLKETEPQPDRIVTSKELREELASAPKQTFFNSGHKYLDELIGGFGEGDLIIVGGTQKSGKSTYLQTLTKKFASQGIGCLWFSIEMSNRELLTRFGDSLPIFLLPRVMPTNSTIDWIEKKIVEAKAKHGVKIIFVDHLGMISDEATARERNQVDILDSRLQRLKRFAISQRVCIIAVATFVLSSVRKKTQTPTTGDFRGTAMLGYTADTLLAIDRLVGGNKMTTANEEFDDIEALKGGLLVSSDAYLYIMDCRRTGVRRTRIKIVMDEHGDLQEWEAPQTSE